MERVELAEQDEPVVVQHCHIAGGGGIGMGIIGSDSGRATPSRRIIVRENRMEGGTGGIFLTGELHQINIVGNRIAGSKNAGLELKDFIPASRYLLFANNTFLECDVALRLFDKPVAGQ